jgi:hypothetical protein
MPEAHMRRAMAGMSDTAKPPSDADVRRKMRSAGEVWGAADMSGKVRGTAAEMRSAAADVRSSTATRMATAAAGMTTAGTGGGSGACGDE